MTLLVLKAIHIIGFVSWFAGLFYLVRMFVYHREAQFASNEVLEQQFALMEKRVYHIICNPAMMVTFLCGSGMLVINPGYLSTTWIWVKLGSVFMLLGYHLWSKSIMKRLKKAELKWTSMHLRLFNEIPTVILIYVVLLAVIKDSVHFLVLFAYVTLVAVLIVVFAKLYKRLRRKGAKTVS